MKKLKLIFWVTGILLIIGSGSYFLGFGGTRFTEKLWAIGTEEDYLVFPENRENILYQSGNDYYLKCEKRTYPYASRPQRIGPSDCLAKTQVSAKSKDEV